MRWRSAYFSVLLLYFIVSSCTGLKHITSDDPLYSGNVLKVTDKASDVHYVVNSVNNELHPKPNQRFLWMRPSLARYNMLSDSSRKKKFWKKRIAAPVKLSAINPEHTASAIQNRLFHNGYFNNYVTFDTTQSGKKTRKYIYTVNPQRGYLIGDVKYPDPLDSLSSRINNMQHESSIVQGDIYTLAKLKKEKKRIDSELKELGYYNFNEDFISFIADSVTVDHVVNIRVIVKPDILPESRIAYTIGKIFIQDGYDIENQDRDTIDFDPYYLITADSTIRISALKRGIFIEPGEFYSRSKRFQTVRYLNNLPIIRSASASFIPGAQEEQLDAIITYSTRKQFAYSAEFNAIFRSTNYFGPGIILGHSNRNVNRNAEQLKVNLTGRFEVQIADGVVNPAYELGIEVNYTIPRLVPSRLDKIGRMKLPSTKISLGYNLFNRVDLYRLNSVFIDYKYHWRRNERISHTFKPLEIIFTSIPESSKSQEFKDYLEENPGVQRSFDEQFIVGLGYNFTFEPPNIGRHNLYLKTGVDLAGNLLYAGYSLFNAKKDTVGRYTLFSVPFSQYARFTFDITYGFDLNNNSALVTRVATGLGIPYSNSTVLPYVRQFYVGGTNSMRSFIARSLGPGSEIPPDGFNDLTGDLRLEWNLEYRFTIARKFKGALFSDIGNIWLYREDETRPGGVFHFSTFIEQLAMSAGWGLRWDFDFVVARLDFAYSLRVPYLPEGERWVSDIKFLKPTFNLAIGYPF